MILADKIINERKKLGWSQEELAYKLDVSRQSVSKWESAQTVPDLNRILKMAELFNVTTDYLLKDDFNEEVEKKETESVDVKEDSVRVSMEEAQEFLSFERKEAPIIALSVALCVASPIVLILLAGFSDIGYISETLAVGIGLPTLLVMIAIAVLFFVRHGLNGKRFEYLERKNIDTEYGVSGMVKEKKKASEQKHTILITTGVVLCVLSVIPLIISSIISESSVLIVSMVALLLLIVSLAVYMFVSCGIENGSYEKLLENGDYSRENKEKGKTVGKVSSIFWMIVTALYLAISFITSAWGKTWIIWPVAAVISIAINLITKSFMKYDD